MRFHGVSDPSVLSLTPLLYTLHTSKTRRKYSRGGCNCQTQHGLRISHLGNQVPFPISLDGATFLVSWATAFIISGQTDVWQGVKKGVVQTVWWCNRLEMAALCNLRQRSRISRQNPCVGEKDMPASKTYCKNSPDGFKQDCVQSSIPFLSMAERRMQGARTREDSHRVKATDFHPVRLGCSIRLMVCTETIVSIRPVGFFFPLKHGKAAKQSKITQ